MELRGDATTEVRKAGGMSKGPDLSAFPIPRKGGAKPIATDEAAEVAVAEEQRGGEATTATPQSPHAPQPAATAVSDRPAPIAEFNSMAIQRTAPPGEAQPQAPTSSGQTVATTVKLDENRYLRLADAGKPGPGRLKRRTIQEMVIEALDEWFERRGI
jgi:hypothetical protein